MRQLTITLEGEKPVSNNQFYSGMHWTKRKQLADAAHLLIRSQIDPEQPPFDEPVHITMTVYAADRVRRDIDNMNVKMYIDGLKPHVILEDDWRYVSGITKLYKHDKARPRVEIVIKEASA